MFCMTNKDAFNTAQLSEIRSRLASVSDDKFAMLSSTSFQNATVVLIISIFVGELGVDRFMIGDTAMGVLKLITGGGCGIWWLIDLFSIKDKTYEYNYRKFNEVISY